MASLTQTELDKLRSTILAAKQQMRSANTKWQSIQKKRQDLEAQYQGLALQNVDKQHSTTLNETQNQLTQLSDSQEKESGNRYQAWKDLQQAIQEIHVKTDPQQLTDLLDDRYPILLLPVRLEARFMTIKHVARITNHGSGNSIPVSKVFPGRKNAPVMEDRKELWVRLFPDDIAIHTHEDALTEEEEIAGRLFWTYIWKAATDEDRRLGAWRGLVGGIGPERAAWIAKQTTPTNPADQPSVPVPDASDLPTPIQWPQLSIKAAPWTETPHTRVMPDRFVIRLISGTKSREVMGNPIPDPLPLNMNPMDESESFDPVDGQLVFPDQLKWLTDFKAAEQVGMAIRIPLSAAEAVQGFDRVLALGIKHSADQDQGKDLLEELLQNHQYKNGGASILAQGTKTNNSKEEGTEFTAYTDQDDSYFDLALGATQYEPAIAVEQKRDGQHLAEGLGISYASTQRMSGAGNTDTKEAIAMNKALWPATFGYFLSQLLHPLVGKRSIHQIRQHFHQHVLGRGKMPSIRIDDQPYGILPTTAYTRWEFDSKEPNYTLKNDFFNNLLVNMESTWADLAQQVAHAHASGDPREVFLSIMGQHASSVEYYQRGALGRIYLWNLVNLVNLLDSGPPIQDPGEIAHVNLLDFFQEFPWLSKITSISPEIFDLAYIKDQQFLNGPKIDSLPLSETRRVKELSEGWNYLKWLEKSTYQEIFAEDFSKTGAFNPIPPTNLLYLLMRHALLLEYQRSGVEFLIEKKAVADQIYKDLEILNIGPLTFGNQVSTLQKSIAFKEALAQEKKIEKDVLGSLKPKMNKMSLQEFESEKARMKAEKRNELADELTNNIEKAVSSSIAKGNPILPPASVFNQSYGTLTANQPLSTYIDQLLQINHPDITQISEIKEAISCLEQAPTARLERCLSEHLDLGTYRLDAWFSSFVLDRLEQQRFGSGKRQEGIYVGSFSWLLDLRPGAFPGLHFEEVDLNIGNDSGGAQSVSNLNILDPSLLIDNSPKNEDPTYAYLGNNGISSISYDQITDGFVLTPRTDPGNLGFVHAPSLNHATAAAVLRATYESHRQNTGSADNAFAVNLNSHRVRKAIYVLEGIKHGQELGALLGYQFERQLNDQTTVSLNLNAYIYDLRLAFPQVSGRVTDNQGVTEQNSAEAYNVINGLKLLEAYQADSTNWRNGINLGNQSTISAIEAAINEMADTLDAVYDLMMAEAVYQAAQGNQARAGAALNILNGKGNPIDPEVIQTPREYHHVTHRFGVQFDLSGNGSQVWQHADASLRSLTEPFLNKWLGSLLPAPTKMRIQINYGDIPVEAPIQTPATIVSIANLNLQPIDLFFLMTQANQQGQYYGLSQMLSHYIKQQVLQTDDVSFELQYTTRTGLQSDESTIFELIPLFRQLKILVGESRPLSPEDLLLSSTTDEVMRQSKGGWDINELESRVKPLFQENLKNGKRGFAGILLDLTTALVQIEALDIENLQGSQSERNALDSLRNQLLSYSYGGETGMIPLTVNSYERSDYTSALRSGIAAQEALTEQLATANQFLTEFGTAGSDTEKISLLTQIAQTFFGRSFKIYPAFLQYNPDEFRLAHEYPDYLAHAGEGAPFEWLSSLARVRKPMAAYQKASLFTYSLHGEKKLTPQVVQLPLLPIDENDVIQSRWLGVEYPDGYEVPDENLSLVFHYPTTYKVSQLQAGILIDEWNEAIPIKDVSTGISVHYNNPNSEPPQVCLLAVTPKQTGKWNWDDLMATLNETIDWAKKRGVDPDLIKDTAYAQVLPTIMAALSGTQDTISLDLKRNIIKNPMIGDYTMIRLEDFQTTYTTTHTPNTLLRFEQNTEE